MSTYKNHLMTDDSITIIFDDKMVPIVNGHPQFEAVKDALVAGDTKRACDLIDTEALIRLRTKGQFEVVDGEVVVDGEALPDALNKRILQFIEMSIDCKPLRNFWNRLKNNPSEDSRQDLYGFLEHNGVPITTDGHFIGYRRTDENGMDLHSKTNKHIPGQKISMPREGVDPDRHVTCSRGLHIATFNHASDYYPNGILWEVKVDPADVVVVPLEYHNEKMRVCAYTPVKTCGGMRDEPLYTEDDYDDSDGDSDADDFDYESEDDVDTETELEATGGVATEETEENFIKETKGRSHDGRMKIPAKMIRNLGISPGNKVYAWAYYEKIMVSVDAPTDHDGDVHEYPVDKYMNVALPKSLFVSAEMDDSASFKLMGYETHIRITM